MVLGTDGDARKLGHAAKLGRVGATSQLKFSLFLA
jgi:hypothetical protein